MITSKKLEADIPEVDRVQWRKIDAQLYSVLWQSVDPKILLHLRAYKTCFKFWNQAKWLYTNDIQRLYKVASSIVNVRQQDMDLSTYIGQIASLKGEFLTVMPLTTDVGDQRTQIDKFFMVLTIIGLRPDLETVRDQILGSSSVPSLDDVFAHLLRISSTQTLPSDNTSDSSVEYDDYLRYQTTKSASVASIAQTGNVSACLTHTSSLRPWILDSGASDHISGNKDLFSSITTTSTLPTITLANGSQTMAKGFGLAQPFPSLPLHYSMGKTIGIGHESQGLYHLSSPSTPAVCISTDAPLLIHSLLGHPSLSKFQKMVPHFSSLSSLTCESRQLGKHTRVSFPKRLNNWAKSPFELVHTDDKLSAKATKCIFLEYSRLQKGYRCYSSKTHRHFLVADVTFFEDSSFFSTSESLLVSEVLPLSIISPLDAMSSRPLQVYHRRHRVFVPPSLAEVPADSLPIPSASPAPTLPSSADLPITFQKVGCRWVYTVKVGPDGQVDRLKACLVAKGYTQVYGSDYGDTFSPVAKIVSGESGLVCRLRRSLYGLKQSPREWFSCFSSVVQEFDMFRRIEIAQSSSGVVLSQMKYALDILEETGMLDCKPIDTPMDPNVKLIPGQGEPLGDLGRYRRLVGKLNYLTITRPDIFFLVSVSQFLQSPCDSHWDAIIRILRYIKSTPGQGVLYENRGHTQVVGYTNADWAGSPTDRRSTFGYCVFIGDNLISWKSKKQDVMARSSAEVEYRGMTLATCELIWLKHLLQELRFGKDEQMKLICDNQAALHIASNPVFHERTKHIEVDCHFIREKIASGCVAISFVNSNDQLTDIFTKSLRGPRIKYICNKLGAYNIYALA
ncbi:Retrovirus-related Pol polyprotein from transposon RE1 [Vitis vinifera]|uniref:Retrovirus-related Pol polyprotein from transposon RE1 n=1 Tax=Vitis vinifera TaxID=29760 RepID=A0A438IHI0_VITVI|nr:Retrovirus-related Pol polyprotein from transposon RE1 [Vitis vinifera]